MARPKAKRILTVTVLVTALVAMTGSAAQAIIIPTFGATWSYESATSYVYKAWVPGALLSGAGTDDGQTRSTWGSLSDTKVDGHCAVALGGSDLDPGTGLIAAEVCDGQPPVPFSVRSFIGGLGFKFGVMTGPPIGPASDGGHIHLSVQSSLGDADLRTPGTGAAWTYSPDAAWYSFKLQRPGVLVHGNGFKPTPWTRSVAATVENTSGSLTCGSGQATQGAKVAGASVCLAEPPASFYEDDFANGELIGVKACTTQLITLNEQCVTLGFGLGQPQAWGWPAS